MVGSSPLILLNDLILTSNKALPADHQMAAWSLFSVTPVGLALVATGIIYFILAGRFVLPSRQARGAKASSALDYFRETYGVEYDMREMLVPEGSSIAGQTLDDIEHNGRLRVIAAQRGNDDIRIGAGGLARDVGIEAGTVLGVMGAREALLSFADEYDLQVRDRFESFEEALAPTKAGIAEVVIPPGSQLVGKSARDVWMRKTYGISLLALHRVGDTYREGEGVRDMPLQAGDTLVVHTTWDALTRLKNDRNFVVVTTEYPHEELRPQKYPHEELRPQKVGFALLFFSVALFLVLFTDLRLSVALLTGALGMVLSGVLKMEEAYEAVSWKTVFLITHRLAAGTTRAPPDPRSLATVVNICVRGISRSFMVEQGREGCAQEQDCLQYCFQVIFSNSPRTGHGRSQVAGLRPRTYPR
jgi:di/tricarboxylate transporter